MLIFSPLIIIWEMGLLQLHIQTSQLFQEAPVWKDPAVLFDLEDGLQQAVMLVDHQVGQDDGGGPAHPDRTVDKNPSCSGQMIEKKTFRRSKSGDFKLVWVTVERLPPCLSSAFLI